MRSRTDGSPARAANKRKLTELYIRALRPQAAPFNVWDTHERGLVLRMQASGQWSFKFVYAYRSRPRWYHLGKIHLADARRAVIKLRLAVSEGKDPQAEKLAQRNAGTFAELAANYLELHAKRHNKSWKQADHLVQRHLLRPWGRLEAKAINRADVKLTIGRIAAPVLANQVLATASAIFSWAMKQDVVASNPCQGIDRHKAASRERVLSDSELPLFWQAFGRAGLGGTALKLILLTGQRPGEVCHMRWEHIVDGWWLMPGEPVAASGWPGTKNANTHRVWLPAPAQALLPERKPSGFVLGKAFAKLPRVMRSRSVCAELGISDKVTPHDLRRSHGTKITALGFGRDAMNRVQNHREGGIASVYDRHQYAEENKRIMEAVASAIMQLAEGQSGGTNVVPLRG